MACHQPFSSIPWKDDHNNNQEKIEEESLKINRNGTEDNSEYVNQRYQHGILLEYRSFTRTKKYFKKPAFDGHSDSQNDYAAKTEK